MKSLYYELGLKNKIGYKIVLSAHEWENRLEEIWSKGYYSIWAFTHFMSKPRETIYSVAKTINSQIKT